MYSKILIPLDGSKTAEKVLPYARHLAGKFEIPIELLAVIDIAELAAHVRAENARFLDTMIDEGVRTSETYLRGVAATFNGATVKCTVEKGRAEDAIIEKGQTDVAMLIAMATHGRSGLNRFLLGSVAEKVLRGAANPLLLVRATEEALEVTLFRAYHIPYNAYSGDDGYYAVDYDELISAMRDEANEYLGKKAAEVKKLGVEKVSVSAKEGFAGDEIIALGRKTPAGLVAMCSHGRSGVKRWVLGSVTENVVRHTADPVLVARAG